MIIQICTENFQLFYPGLSRRFSVYDILYLTEKLPEMVPESLLDIFIIRTESNNYYIIYFMIGNSTVCNVHL